MDPDPLARLVAVCVLLFLSAIFAASETALFSLSRLHSERIKKEKTRTSALILSLLKDPPRLLITILVVNEVVNISAETLAVSLALDWWGARGKWISIAVLTPVMVILTDILPKTIAVRIPHPISRIVVWPVELIARGLFPLRWVVTGLAHTMSRLIGSRSSQEAGNARAEELKAIVGVGEKEGALDASERQMIHNVFAFRNRDVGDIMTPRMEILSLLADLSAAELLEEVRRNKFSRVPIYRGEKDNVVGILYAKDLIGLGLSRNDLQPGEWKLERILRKPLFVPRQMSLDVLLGEFRRERVHMAMVVDEYGGIVGLVTMEDLLEELFGEIHDEFDVRVNHIREMGPGVFEVSGAMPWREFKEWAGISAEEEIGTLGSWLTERIGRIPKEGETIQHEGWRILVSGVRGGKIERLRVERLERASE